MNCSGRGGTMWKFYQHVLQQHTRRSLAIQYRQLRFKGQTAESAVHPPQPPPPSTKKAIKIPERIHRDSTDILKALASTVGTDFTAPQYRFHDDPYLIPMSNLNKRSYVLSKEAGKKAAMWIKQKHADLFQHVNAEPFIDAFSPKIIITDETPVDESTVNLLIDQGRLIDAIKVYDMLKAKGNAISVETTKSLLEFTAYYNETEPLDEELLEERWFTSSSQTRDRQRNTWKSAGIAERLFKELENPDAASYCAIIRGRAKYFQAEKAWELLKEARSGGIIIDADTYNSVIRVANFCRESSEMRWQLVEEIVREMEGAGVRPNLDTLNALLEALNNLGNPRQSKTLMLEVLTEFKKLGIEPCLASYYYIINTFCKERGPVSTILVDIMKEIEGKEFSIQDIKDTFFFITAMDVCRYHLQDLELATKVDALLHTGNNYDLIGESFKESVYYRNYFGLKATLEPFDKFMEFYNKLVPNIYTPEPGVMEDVLRSLELNQSIQYLPQLWSDIVIFDQSRRETLVALFLHIMASMFPPEDTPEALKLKEEFVSIGWKIWITLETQEEGKGKKIYWSGKMLGDLLTITVKANQFEKSGEIIKKLLTPKQDVIGVPEIAPLKLFLDKAIELQNGAMGLACLQFVSEAGYGEVNEMAEELSSRVKLDALQLSRLNNLVGFARVDENRGSSKRDKIPEADDSNTFTSTSGVPYEER